MTDLWVPNVRQAQVQPRVIDKTGRFASPLSGNVRTVKRSGTRWGFMVTYASLTAAERARLEPLLVWLGGAENRWLYSPGDHVQRGSFPSKELFLNGRFENGITGWGTGADYTLSAADGILQMRRVGSTVPSNILIQGVSGLTPYAPLVLRSMTVEGQGAHTAIGPQINFSETSLSSTPGYRQLTYVPRTNNVTAGLADYAPAGQSASDYFNVPFMSLARCPLVDNGVNLITNSDGIGGSGWTLAAVTVGNNGTQSPDGNLAAQYLAENGATSSHYVYTSCSVTGPRDLTFAVYVHAATRTIAWLQLQETTGGGVCSAWFNLNNGAVGTVNNGTNWSDTRAFIQSVGNGWFRIAINSRLTNSATSVTPILGSGVVDGSASYAGSGVVSLLTWRANVSASGVPARAVQTAGAAIPGNNQSGSGIYVKGLPANTDGLLLSGDYFEINRELKKCTATLNSDAFGLGYLQFSPPLRFAPLDNDPVILTHPVGSFIATENENGWTANPGIFTDLSINLIEAY
jgi:hypothetical protein